MLTQKLEYSNGVINKTINVSSFPAGLYILKVTNGKEQQVIKFIKAD